MDIVVLQGDPIAISIPSPPPNPASPMDAGFTSWPPILSVIPVNRSALCPSDLHDLGETNLIIDDGQKQDLIPLFRSSFHHKVRLRAISLFMNAVCNLDHAVAQFARPLATHECITNPTTTRIAAHSSNMAGRLRTTHTRNGPRTKKNP